MCRAISQQQHLDRYFSTGTSTVYNCEDRAGAIRESTVTMESVVTKVTGLELFLSTSSSFQNQAGVEIRFIVDSDAFTPHYGGIADEKEGLTVAAIRIVDGSGNTVFEDDFSTTTSAYHYGAVFPYPSSNTQAGADDWAHYVFERGNQDITSGFEDSTASQSFYKHAFWMDKKPFFRC